MPGRERCERRGFKGLSGFSLRQRPDSRLATPHQSLHADSFGDGKKGRWGRCWRAHRFRRDANVASFVGLEPRDRSEGARERGSEGGKEEEGIMGHVPSAEAELLKLGLFLGWSGGAGEAASSPRWIKKKACREVEAEPPPTAGKMP